ncbi:hypothetical protein QQG55_2760 [Brugia pahangi]
MVSIFESSLLLYSLFHKSVKSKCEKSDEMLSSKFPAGVPDWLELNDQSNGCASEIIGRKKCGTNVMHE